jgi:hypothetical protein
MNCEVDYCDSRTTQTLTVTTEDEIITLRFCDPCATALREQLAKQLGVDVRLVDLRGGSFGGTIGELQAALDYLDGPDYMPQSTEQRRRL